MSSTGTRDAAGPPEGKEAKTSMKGTKSVCYQEKYDVTPKLPKLKRPNYQGTCGAHTEWMSCRELVRHLEEMKAHKGSRVGGPYDVIPCVPLSPQTGTRLLGKPHISRPGQKNIYKETSDLDMEKNAGGTTDCDIRLGVYIPGCNRRFNPFTIDLMLPNKTLPELTMNDHDFLRHQAALGKQRFLGKVSRRKLSSALHFWDRIKAGQTDKETRNPRFCSLFSTYSWSWGAQRELLTTEELWQWETKKHWETACAPLQTGIQWNYTAPQEDTDVERTEDPNDSAWDLSESPKPEREEVVPE